MIDRRDIVIRQSDSKVFKSKTPLPFWSVAFGLDDRTKQKNPHRRHSHRHQVETVGIEVLHFEPLPLDAAGNSKRSRQDWKLVVSLNC